MESDGDKTGIRHRRIGDSQKPGGDHPVGSVSHSVLGSVISPLFVHGVIAVCVQFGLELDAASYPSGRLESIR